MSTAKSTNEVLSPPSQHPAAEYIRDLFKPEDHVCVTVIDQKSRGENGGQRQTVNRVLTVPDLTSQETIADLEALNAEGYSIFGCLQPIKPGSTSRTKQDIAEARRVFLDFDENAAAAHEKILTSSLVPEPHWVLESSPGKLQMVWNVEPMSAAELESLLDAMIQEFGADPACSDVSRVLRLPGFRNCKYPARPLVQLKESPFDASPYPRTAFKMLAPRKESSTQINSGSVDPKQPILSGKRNDTLASLAGSMRHKGMGAEAIEAALQITNRNQCQPPLDPSEVTTIARSVARYEVKPTPPCIIGGQRIDADAPQVISPAEIKILDLWQSAVALGELADVEMDWVVPDFVMKGEVTMLSGDFGCFKTYITYFLADAISRGGEFIGRDCQKHPILILDRENSGATVSLRRHLVGELKTSKDVRILGRMTPEKAPELTDERLLELCRQIRPGIIIDSFTDFHPGLKESDPDDMTEATHRVNALIDAGAVFVILIHHVPKNTSGRGGHYRGTTAIPAGIGGALLVEKVNRTGCRITGFKTRDAEDQTVEIELQFDPKSVTYKVIKGGGDVFSQTRADILIKAQQCPGQSKTNLAKLVGGNRSKALKEIGVMLASKILKQNTAGGILVADELSAETIETTTPAQPMLIN